MEDGFVGFAEGVLLLIDRAVALGGGDGRLEKRLCLPLTWKVWSGFPASGLGTISRWLRRSLRAEDTMREMDHSQPVPSLFFNEPTLVAQRRQSHLTFQPRDARW